MHWVIQNNLYNEDGFTRLIDALVKMDIPHSIHKVIPFVRELYPDIDPDGKVVVMGSYSMSYIAQARGWTPGTFLNENFEFIKQVVHWDRMLNDDAWLGPLRFATVFDEPMFIRPTNDGKSFAGTVMDAYELEAWKRQILALDSEDCPTVTGDTRVMVCRKKKIYNETRCWIVDEKVVTGSVYKVGTRVICDSHVRKGVIKFAEKQARIWSPHRAYVMDVADTPEGLKIIEVNNLNSSGFYAADVQKLVFAIEEAFNN